MQSDLAQPISNHSMISHFMSHDLDPTLNSRCRKYFRSNHKHSPCNIKYTSNRSILEKPFSLAHLARWSSPPYIVWSFINTSDQNVRPIPQTKTLDQYLRPKPWFSIPYAFFLLVKVRVYVYVVFFLWTSVYMLFWQSEPAYAS